MAAFAWGLGNHRSMRLAPVDISEAVASNASKGRPRPHLHAPPPSSDSLGDSPRAEVTRTSRSPRQQHSSSQAHARRFHPSAPDALF